jgi:RNase H-fold protein (predicted Holliday junction resolvase)
MIKDIDLSLELKLIDERGTTERAERLYFKEHPPRGIKKLLSLFVSWRPSQPVDDYAAYLLVRKYLNRRG